MKKIGFLGGTFDPIHLGHLNLGIELQEKHELDEVWFCPAARSPLKTVDPLLTAHRAEMVKLALEPLKNFHLIDVEMKESAPSFTIDTLKKLVSLRRDQFYLLLGEDLLSSLHRWKDIEILLNLAPPLIGTRLQKEFYKREAFSKQINDLIDRGMTEIPLFDITSTEVRRRLIKKEFCGHLLPSKVLDYITLHDLYSEA